MNRQASASDSAFFFEVTVGLAPDKLVSSSSTAQFLDSASASNGVPRHAYAADSGIAFDYLDGGIQGDVSDSASFSDEASAALYLGRYRRGDKVDLSLSLPSTPDAPPIAVVLDSDSTQIASMMMPAANQDRTNFALPLPVGLPYSVGSFSVYFHYTIAGTTSLKQVTFDVVSGGDSGGSVIALYSLDRVESRCIVAQLDSGALVLGKTPTVA